ncbi:leucine-rich repeat domain-containing protein, partial [Histophilus somni]|uniref:leucine-rich repeat domain-containing protein n=1 Tax=Histophilus somni TaxID=731 RepID=UPI00201E7922
PIRNIDLSGLQNLKVIENEAFSGHQSREINISDLPNLQRIREKAFSSWKGDKELERVTMSNLPELSYIGDQTFVSSFTEKLSTITMENIPKLKKIPDYMFKPKGLKNLKLSGMESLVEIGTSAFGGDLKNKPSKWNSQFLGNDPKNNNNIGNLDLTGLPNLEIIGESAFASGGVTSIKFPENSKIKEIRNSAFITRSQLNGAERKISELDFTKLPELEFIGESAFFNQNISRLDFSQNTKLKSIGEIIDGNNSNYRNNAGAFGRNPIEALNFGDIDSLTKIGNSAFSNSSLSSVDMSKLSKLEEIGSSAFHDSTSLSNVDFPNPTESGLKYIHEEAFRNTNLSKVDLSNYPELISIGRSSFEQIMGLSQVKISNNPKLKTIEFKAFDGGHRKGNISKVNIESNPSLTSIKSRAFSDNNISELTVSNNDSLILVEDAVFRDNKLIEATFDNNPKLANMDQSAFTGNIGSKDYSNLVVVWSKPVDKTLLTSKGSYVVNPKLEDN